MSDSIARRSAGVGVTAAAALIGGASGAPAASAAPATPAAGHVIAARPPGEARDVAFGYDHVLGTSMDLVVRGGTASDAHAAVTAAMAEIDRLAAILNTRDAHSEVSRLNKARATPHRTSPELAALLDAYQRWSVRTGGVISSRMQRVIDLWRRAEAEQRLPDVEAIAAARAATGAINVDALGKAFIVDRALAAAVRATPGVAGVLLNVGGDIAVVGGPWVVAIANPSAPADNAAPLAHVALTNQAIATSAGYERPFTIDGRRYSHIIDARTGRPADAAASCTVIAGDAVTANALALATCVLGCRDGAPLIARYAAGALVVEGDRAVHVLGGVPMLTPPTRVPLAAATAPSGWAADHQVTVSLELKRQQGRRTHRPYVAIWVEDANNKVVRTVTIWGNDPKYLRDLSAWSKAAGGRNPNVAAVTRATRQPGKYTVTWDGLDDAGKPLPAGKYTVHVEINREHGTHAINAVTLDCGGTATAAEKIAASDEAEEITVTYAGKDGK